MHEKNDRFARFLKKRYPGKEVITLDQHRDCTFYVENDKFVGDFYLIEPYSYKTYHLYAFGENEYEHERISCTRVKHASREDSDKILRFFFKDEKKKQIRVIANSLAFSQSFLSQISQHVKLLPDLEPVIRMAKPVIEPDKYYELESKPRSSSVNVVLSYPMHSDYIDSRNHTEFNQYPYMDVNETKKHRKTSYVDNGNVSALIVPDVHKVDTGRQRKTSYGENGYGNGSTSIAPVVNQFHTDKHRKTNCINNSNDDLPIAQNADETETRKPTSTSSSGSNRPTILQRIKVSLDPVASFFGPSFTKSDPKISPHISGGSFGISELYNLDSDRDENETEIINSTSPNSNGLTGTTVIENTGIRSFRSPSTKTKHRETEYMDNDNITVPVDRDEHMDEITTLLKKNKTVISSLRQKPPDTSLSHASHKGRVEAVDQLIEELWLLKKDLDDQPQLLESSPDAS